MQISPTWDHERSSSSCLNYEDLPAFLQFWLRSDHWTSPVCSSTKINTHNNFIKLHCQSRTFFSCRTTRHSRLSTSTWWPPARDLEWSHRSSWSCQDESRCFQTAGGRREEQKEGRKETREKYTEALSRPLEAAPEALSVSQQRLSSGRLRRTTSAVCSSGQRVETGAEHLTLTHIYFESFHRMESCQPSTAENFLRVNEWESSTLEVGGRRGEGQSEPPNLQIGETTHTDWVYRITRVTWPHPRTLLDEAKKKEWKKFNVLG